MKLSEAAKKYTDLYMTPNTPRNTFIMTDEKIAQSDVSIIFELASDKAEARRRINWLIEEKPGGANWRERRKVFREALQDIAPQPRS